MNIAVIGAGISGLTAARCLANGGHDVVVFEKSRRPGGRLATRHVQNVELGGAGTVDLAFDHGAQYITARDPHFALVLAHWARERLVTKWNGRIVSFDGEGWEAVAPGTDRYVGVPGMGAIGRSLAIGLDIRYESCIESLDALAGFDRVVLSVPAPDAAPLVAASPALAARVAGVTMKPCWAVLAAFEEPVRAPFDGAFVQGSPLSWVARTRSTRRPGDPDAWVLHASTQWSGAHLLDPPDTVGPFLLGAFDVLVRTGVPKPLYLTAHRWRYAGADPPLAVGALRDETSKLVVCGDWCAGARVEDAYVSGLAAAREVVGVLRS